MSWLQRLGKKGKKRISDFRTPPPLQIEYFRIDPIESKQYPTEYQLSWKTVGAARVFIVPVPGTAKKRGKKRIRPQSGDQVFRIKATDKQGKSLVQEFLTKQVLIEEFSASETIVVEGTAVSLRWQVEHAKSIVIEGVGNVSNRDSITIQVSKRLSSLTLLAYGEASWAKRTIHLTVQPLPNFDYRQLTLPPPIQLGGPKISIQNPIKDKSKEFYQIFSEVKAARMISGKEVPRIEAQKLPIYEATEELKTQLRFRQMAPSLHGIFERLKNHIIAQPQTHK